MLSTEDNKLLTETGPGTPGGALLRRYWQPVALSEELPHGGAPKPVRILGEDLALFRDPEGRPGLLGIHCSHRAADLSYGRVEDGGLRCLYHGWLYDVEGRCLEQPGEPAGSRFADKVRHLAYPVREAGGLLLTYMGPDAPPALPQYEFMVVPDEHRFVSKVYSECNYLQGNEGNIDPVHLSYLHKFFRDDARATGGQNSARTVAGSNNTSSNTYFGRDVCPTIEVEEADFGLRIFSIREADEGKKYVRVTNFVYPNLATNPQGVNGYNVNWHVPIDDTHHWKVRIAIDRRNPMDHEKLRAQFFADVDAEGRATRNLANRFLQDREEMKTRSFIGMGSFFPGHDLYATESQGAVQDRTTERLGYTDKAITASRRLLLRAVSDVQEGGEAPGTFRDGDDGRAARELVCSDQLLPASEDWRTYWRNEIPA